MLPVSLFLMHDENVKGQLCYVMGMNGYTFAYDCIWGLVIENKMRGLPLYIKSL